MVALLFLATTLHFIGRKRRVDWWLAGFLLSLITNTLWAFIAPILESLDGTRALFDIGNVVTRIVCLGGYVALLGFVIVNRRNRNGVA